MDAGSAAAAVLAGLLEAGHHADIGCERGGVLEACRIAYSGNDAVDVRRTSRFDAEQQLADFVDFKQGGDVALDLEQAHAPQVEVLADMVGLQPIRWRVVLADGALGGLD